MKIDPKKDDQEDGLQTKRWCESNQVALKKALRSAVYQMFDPDVVESVDHYLDARALHELGKRKRGVDAVATITIHLDKWVDELPEISPAPSASEMSDGATAATDPPPPERQGGGAKEEEEEEAAAAAAGGLRKVHVLRLPVGDRRG